VIPLLFVIGVVIAVNCFVVHVWWHAVIRDHRWVFLFPVALPLVLFGPMWVVGLAAQRFSPGVAGAQKFTLTILWLVPTLFASLLGARRFHYSRRDHGSTNV
jgi:hypothetical protein